MIDLFVAPTSRVQSQSYFSSYHVPWIEPETDGRSTETSELVSSTVSSTVSYTVSGAGVEPQPTAKNPKNNTEVTKAIACSFFIKILLYS